MEAIFWCCLKQLLSQIDEQGNTLQILYCFLFYRTHELGQLAFTSAFGKISLFGEISLFGKIMPKICTKHFTNFCHCFCEILNRTFRHLFPFLAKFQHGKKVDIFREIWMRKSEISPNTEISRKADVKTCANLTIDSMSSQVIVHRGWINKHRQQAFQSWFSIYRSRQIGSKMLAATLAFGPHFSFLIWTTVK